jgi:hypothetical protein
MNLKTNELKKSWKEKQITIKKIKTKIDKNTNWHDISYFWNGWGEIQG